MKRTHLYILEIIMLLMIILFICVESRPVSIVSSTVFSAGDETEITMYVIVNSMKKIDKEKVVQDVISQHNKINGKRGNEVYTVVMYRTMLHYRKNWEYETFSCE